jgi:hypothetical protein
MKGITLRVSLFLGAALIAAVLVAGVAFAASNTSFRMAHNPCVSSQGAHADVTVNSLGPVEVMNVTLSHMPPKTAFDLFVIQQPGPPFGVSWYLGDMRTDANGNAHQRFIGRFSRETFAVAPGSTSAPQVDGKDDTTNPAFGPIHTLHLGLWFNTPAGASRAGCPTSVTPFNGDHNAGVQALHTNPIGNDRGPLDRIN